MKIGIITITNGENYGNRLQNYATHTVLSSLGFDVETIKNTTGVYNQSWIKFRIYNIMTKIYTHIKCRNIKRLNIHIRRTAFNRFTQKYIKQSPYTVSKDNVPKNIENDYDYFVCGSDQIWNPNFYFNSSVEFLTFAKPGQRIAYCASFGVSHIQDEYIEKYRKWINGMDYLSVREDAGAKIIKDLTNRTAEVLVDPTLMLTKEQWLSVSHRPKNLINKKYILTYFLGNKSSKINSYINKIAKSNNYDVINLLDINDRFSFGVGPSEFITLINECELMCTDSFHGVVFSILMKTPFIVFERNDNAVSMNSRLDTLLSLFNLKSRLYENITNENEIFNVDYSNIEEILNKERNKSWDYLKNVFKIKNDVNEEAII